MPIDFYPYILAGSAVLAFGISWLLTPRLRDLAIRRGLFDMPAKRKIHKVPIPRIGGVAIFAGFLVTVLGAVGLGLLVPNFWNFEDVCRIGLLLLGSTLVAGVMLVDDLKGLPPLPRLAWQFGAAAIVIVPQLLWNGSRPIGVLIDNIAGYNLLFLAAPFTFFWIVGMMNTVNWTDGMDGLAGGVVGIGALILFLETVFQFVGEGSRGFQFTTALLSLALAASIGGFLIFNWHPASIIMGDSGAMFLGYALAVISIIDGAKVASALLIIGFPVLDVAFVILNRIRRGQSPLRADRTHIHQRLLDIGWSTPRIVGLFYFLSLIFGIIGVLPVTQSKTIKFISLVALVVCLIPLLVYSVRHSPRQPELEERQEADPERVGPTS